MKNTNEKPVSVVSARVESCYFFDGITYDPDGRGDGCPLDDLQTAEKGIMVVLRIAGKQRVAWVSDSAGTDFFDAKVINNGTGLIVECSGTHYHFRPCSCWSPRTFNLLAENFSELYREWQAGEEDEDSALDRACIKMQEIIRLLKNISGISE